MPGRGFSDWFAALDSLSSVTSPLPRSLAAFTLVLALPGLACSGSIEEGKTSVPTGGAMGSPPVVGGGGQAPGGTNPTPGTGAPPTTTTPPTPAGACALPPRRIWKLTPVQYGRAIEAVFPGRAKLVGAGDRIAASLGDPGGFSNRADALSMTGPHVTQILKTSFEIANEVGAAPESLVPCLPAGAKDAACVRTLVTTYAPRAFRRDLSDAEITSITGFVSRQIAGADLRTGVQQFFLYLFSSPNFLYRTELGPDGSQAGAVSLTAFEKASALSFFLGDGPPDAQLLAAARSGALDKPEGVAAQTRRLATSAESAPGLMRFLRESLSLDLVRASRKDVMVYPAWTDGIAGALADESERFVRHVLWQDGGKLSTLLTAEYSLLDSKLASYYGVAAPAGAGFAKVSFPSGQRAGLFTQAAWLAAKADDDDTAPVRRGLFLREHLLCEKVPDPPATVNAVPPQPDGKRTQRERLATHSADVTCAGCHDLMDPIGLSFETYDGVGRYRTMDVGKTIETAGTITLGGGRRNFDDAVALMKILAAAPEVSRCFVATAFRYAHGRSPDEGGRDQCALDRLSTAFGKSDGNIIDLAVALTTDETFFARQ